MAIMISALYEKGGFSTFEELDFFWMTFSSISDSSLISSSSISTLDSLDFPFDFWW